MKQIRISFCLAATVLAMLFTFSLAPAHASPLSGTKTVGPTGDYASLTAAIADVQGAGNGLGGALILELEASYVSTVETFPISIPALNGSSAANTLTIRPASAATALSISSADTTAATVDLNGAIFVTIDGRPGGVGSHAGSGAGAVSQLTIANTDPSGVAVRFVNEASSNIIRYTTLRGLNGSAASGTVVFGATTGPNGNDNNILDHCNIGDGVNTPANGIYSLGSAAPSDNSGNAVSNCNIYNFYSATTSTDAAGVRLDGGNTDWTITGNSFYQTATRALVTAKVRAIYVNNNTGGNFIATGNYIGGGAPNAGGSAWTVAGGTSTYMFIGIHLNVGANYPSSVQGNTIQNFVWANGTIGFSSLPGNWCGIFIQAGSVNAGTLTGNTIGSGTGTGSISFTSAVNPAFVFGIGSQSGGQTAIANNTIGSIAVYGTSSGVSASIAGIQVTAGSNTITSNIVGSATTANSLNAATSSTSVLAQQVAGILSSSSTGASITGNLVANLNNNYAGTASAGQVRGIVASAGVNNITGNTVRNLTTTSANIGGTTSASVLGISLSSTVAGQALSQNTVHSLANTTGSAEVKVTGITFNTTPPTGTNFIARNLVHSLALSSTNTSSNLRGLEVSGAYTAQNNMVRLGIDANGLSTAGAATIYGILEGGWGRSFYHNSVYIGGEQTSGSSKTYALYYNSSGSEIATYRNNILVNARSRFAGTSKHYAIFFFNLNLGFVSDGNLFLASGTGGVVGNWNASDRTLAGWQSATGQDAHSLNQDPLFLNPAGNAASLDLHIAANSPANNTGLSLPAVTDDFDGLLRSPFTPDIGAAERNPAPSSPVTITSLAWLGNGSSGTAQLGFTNLTGVGFTVFGTTNAALPINAWSPIGPAVETPSGSGHFSFSDPQATNYQTRLYRLRSP
jgi:trimeric autotransporter adhesin